MTAKLIDGRAIAEKVLAAAAVEVARLKADGNITPGLAAVIVGNDPASEVYVRNKTRACSRAGMVGETFTLPESVSQAEVLELVERLNDDDRFHGVLVQLRLPAHIDDNLITGAISPEKDVDGVHPLNLGRLALGLPGFVPATPAGIQRLLEATGHDPEGKHVVICGRSIIVGKSLALLLMQKGPGGNATVTVCHTKTVDIENLIRQADILVVDTGQPQWVTGDMVKNGVVAIDVGVNRVPDATAKRGYRLVGDIEFASVEPKASAITPVPGGVGPMTVAMVIENTIKAARMTLERRPQKSARR